MYQSGSVLADIAHRFFFFLYVAIMVASIALLVAVLWTMQTVERNRGKNYLITS